MNSEEKILELLGKMQADLTGIKDNAIRQSIVIDTIQKNQREQGMKLMEQDTALESLGKDIHELQNLSQRTAVLLETEFADKLQLLCEGQVLLQQTLSPKERVEVLEDDVISLKTAVKIISKRLAALEKAQ